MWVVSFLVSHTVGEHSCTSYTHHIYTVVNSCVLYLIHTTTHVHHRAYGEAVKAQSIAHDAWQGAIARVDMPWWKRQLLKMQAREPPSVVPWSTGVEYARALLVLSNVVQAQGRASEGAAHRAEAQQVLRGEHMAKALDVGSATRAGSRAAAAVATLETQLACEGA